MAWYDASENRPMAGRLLVMTILMAEFLAFCFVRRMLQGKGILRAVVLVIFVLLTNLSVIVLLIIWDFSSLQKAQGPYHLTVRELVFGDPDAERQRLLEKLYVAMLQETDPQVRHAYAESIAALKRKLPAAKVAE